MQRIMFDRQVAKIGIGLLALLGILLYNLTHTGGLLASYVHPAWVGFTAAAGVELAIVGLSLRIGELRKSNVNPRFFVVTLIAVVVVSALANISEGYAVKFGEPLTRANIGQLDFVQAVVSLAATGLLSLVTFALAEIVGSDLSQAVTLPGATDVWTSVNPETEVSNEDKPEDADVSNSAQSNHAPVSTPAPQGMVGRATTVKREHDVQVKSTALDRLIGHLSTDPDTSVTDLAKLIGKSRQTVYTYLDELEAAGRLHRNG